MQELQTLLVEIGARTRLRAVVLRTAGRHSSPAPHQGSTTSAALSKANPLAPWEAILRPPGGTQGPVVARLRSCMGGGLIRLACTIAWLDHPKTPPHHPARAAETRIIPGWAERSACPPVGSGVPRSISSSPPRPKPSRALKALLVDEVVPDALPGRSATPRRPSWRTRRSRPLRQGSSCREGHAPVIFSKARESGREDARPHPAPRPRRHLEKGTTTTLEKAFNLEARPSAS